MISRTDKLFIISGLISPLIFAVIVFTGALFFPGYGHVNDYISELGAAESPVQLYANIGFFLTGVFYFLFGIGLYRNYAHLLPGKIGSMFMILGGLSTAAVGFFPCDPGCIDVTVTAEIHQFTSEFALILALVGLIFFIIEEVGGGGFKKLAGNYHFLYILTAFLIPSIAFGFIHLELDNITQMVGLFQRVAYAIPMALMTVVSVYLYRVKS